MTAKAKLRSQPPKSESANDRWPAAVMVCKRICGSAESKDGLYLQKLHLDNVGERADFRSFRHLCLCRSQRVTSSDVAEDARVPGYNTQQCTRGAGRSSTTLLPLLESTYRDPKQFRELRLRKPSALTYGAYGGKSDHAAMLSTLDFANSFENFHSKIAFCIAF
jgi:hypothetical protein